MSATYLRENLKGCYIVKGQETYQSGALIFPFNHPAFFSEEMKNLEVRENDHYSMSYPRSGTHLGMELVYLVMNGGDTEALKKQHIHNRPGQLCVINTPELLSGDCSGIDPGPNPIPGYSKTPSPRFFWAHGLYDFQPTDVKNGKCKVVLVTRNPKSVYVSYFHLMQGFAGLCLPEDGISWENWLAAVMSGESKNMFFGTWFDFYLGWWKNRHNLDIYILQYERIVQECPKVVEELGMFFGKTFTDEQKQKMAKHVSFEEFKKNPSVGQAFGKMKIIKSDSAPHMRKGKVDDWKNMFTVAQSEAFDRLYEEKMRGTGFPAPIYE